MNSLSLNCPHCGQGLESIKTDELSEWGGVNLWACMSNECPFFSNSWEVMARQHVSLGYRYHFSDNTEGALLVASPLTYTDRIEDCMLKIHDEDELVIEETIMVDPQIMNRLDTLENKINNLERKLDQIIMFFRDGNAGTKKP